MSDRTCSIDGCELPLAWKGMCKKHYHAEYYERNREKLKARSLLWAANNPDHKRATDRAWAAANPERKRANDARARAAKPDVHRENHARWYRANRQRNAEGAQRRKARMRGNGYEVVRYERILLEHGMVCHICTLPIASRADLHFDHVIPLAKGGPHMESNIRPAHARCNLSKGARVISN